MKERKLLYDDRVYYCPKSDRTILVKPDWIVSGVRHWFFYDGVRVVRPTGKLSVPSTWVEVARFPEGTL